jgi:hypothetical protein
MSQFEWLTANKKLKLWRLCKIEDSMERWSASPFGLGGLWAKHMGLN